jgi:hypothetical protein
VFLLALALLSCTRGPSTFVEARNAIDAALAKAAPAPPAPASETQTRVITPPSGIEQGRQLESNQPQNQRGGPTVYHRNYDRKGSTTVITGPNGTTVCTDSYGKRSTTGVCF